MKKFIVLIFANAFLSYSVLAQAIEKKEEIRISSIPYPLTWDIAPNSFTVKNNSITINAGKATDLYSFVDGSYYVNTAPKILFSPDADFIFSAKIKVDFKNIYDGGAILIYSDTTTWAKLLFEMHDDKSLGLGASFVKGKHGDDSYHLTLSSNEVYTKVIRSGSIFCFYYSSDGKAWKLLRTFPYDEVKTLKIGFYAQSPKGESCTVEFSDIRYRGEKFKNFFTGE
jgi:regulation of enolase protein 1 (concanavalin A-like superfamily)